MGDSLTERIRAEADIASRTGQYNRLHRLADEVDAALMAVVRVSERLNDDRDAAVDRIAQLEVSLRICAGERRELMALREDMSELRARVEAMGHDESCDVHVSPGWSVTPCTCLRGRVLDLIGGERRG